MGGVNNLKALIFTLLFPCLTPFLAMASPFPGVGAALLKPQSGLFLISHGFHLSIADGWIADEDLRFSSTADPNAKFSIKEENLSADTSLEAYAKKWMKDYASYGFDFLGSRPFVNRNPGNKITKGLVVDLLHKASDKQLRQVIFLNKKQAVVLTCVDQKENFSRLLGDCNRMIRSFQWVNL
jgi:hypothetical protein